MTILTPEERNEKVLAVLTKAQTLLGPTEIARRINEPWCFSDGAPKSNAIVPVLRRIGAPAAGGLYSAPPPQDPGASKSTVDTKIAQDCPGCGAAAKFQHSGAQWKVLCAKNRSLLSVCQKAGPTMFSRKDAVRCWNELK